jgi:hypothetical protein
MKILKHGEKSQISLGISQQFFVRKSVSVSKCGAGEGWRRSVEPIVRKTNKYYIQPWRKRIPYIK